MAKNPLSAEGGRSMSAHEHEYEDPKTLNEGDWARLFAWAYIDKAFKEILQQSLLRGIEKFNEQFPKKPIKFTFGTDAFYYVGGEDGAGSYIWKRPPAERTRIWMEGPNEGEVEPVYNYMVYQILWPPP